MTKLCRCGHSRTIHENEANRGPCVDCECSFYQEKWNPSQWDFFRWKCIDYWDIYGLGSPLPYRQRYVDAEGKKYRKWQWHLDTPFAKCRLTVGLFRTWWRMWRGYGLTMQSWTCHACHEYIETNYTLRHVCDDGGYRIYAAGDQVSFNPPCVCGEYSYHSMTVTSRGIEL